MALAFILHGQPLRDLWWKKRHWDKSFSEYLIIVPPMLTLIIMCWHSYRKEKKDEGWETKKYKSDLSEIGKLCMENILLVVLEWVQL